MNIEFNSSTEKSEFFKTKDLIQSPKFIWFLSISTFSLFTLLLLLLIFVPWQQTTAGDGHVIALDPNDRIQDLESFVDGIVSKWYVKDGSIVKKGDPIVEIIDNDPLLINRLTRETQAKRKKVDVSKIAAQTAKNNFLRQEKLYKEGLASQKDFEYATINYKKLLSQLAQDEAELAKSEVSLSRQELRIVKAPSDGTVLYVIPGSNNLIIKKGDKVARFLPKTQQRAVEIFIDGNDFPLVYAGRKVRIQFEGWPAVQSTGWPSLAIGTFAGTVWSTDSSQEKNGKFRAIIVPDLSERPWPSERFLRQGTRAHAWVTLDEVTLGYELWRRFNGFPIAVDKNLDTLGSVK
ncbi:MAG TPA: HlyD family efflux transporter periplasmic adaptor subunit [Oligoflexia bacterium]|nr:HlyD family efflux transporter periplasmic adaptor subunit [Oligoflexia bacterium]HMR24936.1 HlyD family efflux transporter periplasmic adaptor subunit [Oligoflexia bacterium]